MIWLLLVGLVLWICDASLRKVVGDEARGRLDRLPQALIRLASRYLPEDQREDRLTEWEADCAELCEATKNLPIARFVRSLSFGFGLLVSAKLVTNELTSEQPTSSNNLAGAAFQYVWLRPVQMLIFVAMMTAASSGWWFYLTENEPGHPTSLSTVSPTFGSLTANFGPRWGVLHSGIDIANKVGTPIVSAAAGYVAEVGPDPESGLKVVVSHDDGTHASYGHIDTYGVSEGQRVEAGQLIAEMGNRGFSTGPHLHFEVEGSDGVPVDPIHWLEQRGFYFSEDTHILLNPRGVDVSVQQERYVALNTAESEAGMVDQFGPILGGVLFMFLFLRIRLKNSDSARGNKQACRADSDSVSQAD